MNPTVHTFHGKIKDANIYQQFKKSLDKTFGEEINKFLNSTSGE